MVELEKLSMTGSLAKIDDYITEFETLAPLTGINDKGLLQYFRKGLPEALRKRINNVDPLAVMN